MEKMISFKHLLAKKTYAACYVAQEWRLLQGSPAHLEGCGSAPLTTGDSAGVEASRQACVSSWVPCMWARLHRHREVAVCICSLYADLSRGTWKAGL